MNDLLKKETHFAPSGERAGCWIRLGMCVKCAGCGLRLITLRVVWSDTERDAIFCDGCAEALGAPPRTQEGESS